MTQTPQTTPQSGVATITSGARQTFTWVVELMTIFGALGFLSSIVLNGYVFSQWGLSFLQIASLADVIMSGIQLSIDLALISLAAATGYGIGRFLFIKSPHTYEEMDKLPRSRKLLENARLSICVLALLSSLPGLIYALIFGLPSIKLLVMIAFAVGFVLGNFTAKRLFEQSWWAVAIVCLSITATLSLFVYIYVQAFFSSESVIGRGVERGFVSQRRAFQVGVNGLSNCPSATVLWMGERAIVSRCEASRQIIIVSNGENVLIH